jgi:hypothetical protein
MPRPYGLMTVRPSPGDLKVAATGDASLKRAYARSCYER